MVEVSRDGRRVYFTNSLYSAVDDQFYPDGIKGWMVKVNAKPEGGIEFDEDFFLAWPMATCRIKCACKAETRPRIPIAIVKFEGANSANSASRRACCDTICNRVLLAQVSSPSGPFEFGEAQKWKWT